MTTDTKRPSYTNSSLSTARLCMRKYELQYVHRLERITDEGREALQVGTAWHKMHHWKARGLDPYAAASKFAPSFLWTVKLACLFAAHEWYWQKQDIKVVAPERKFKFAFGADPIEGQIDASVENSDGRRGLLEYKTTSDGVDAESDYWLKLRMDTQVGIYALAEGLPQFILYDVVRKPTINPKALTKDDVKRMRTEQSATGAAIYFKQQFIGAELDAALNEARETPTMYGARLTADIGDRPEFYFGRREVSRTDQDFRALADDINGQIGLIEHADRERNYPRNPNTCHEFGRCVFFDLCANNKHPVAGEVPEGFRIREHLHPELADDEQDVPPQKAN